MSSPGANPNSPNGPSSPKSVRSKGTKTTSDKVRILKELEYLKRKQEIDRKEKELEMQKQELMAQRQIMEKELELQREEQDDQVDDDINDMLKDLPKESEKEKVDRMFVSKEPINIPVVDSSNTVEVNLLAKTLLRMKPISIKPFNGNPQEFARFYARFISLEEDNCFTNKELLQLLLDSVDGKAEQALQGFYPGTNYYYEAMDVLKKRFGDRTQVITATETKLREHPRVDKRNPVSLRSLTDTIAAVIATYRSLDLHAELISGSNVIHVTEKLPMDMRIKWERDTLSKNERATLEDLHQWLDKETSILEKIHAYKQEKPTEQDTKRRSTMVTEVELPLCALHQNSRHHTRECEKFKATSPKEREEIIKTKKLCWMCLKPRHGKCSYRTTCETCQGKHHTLAHDNVITYRNSKKETPQDTNQGHTDKAKPNHHSYPAKQPTKAKASLPLVNVIVKGPKATKKTTALIDTGSDTTFMTKGLSKSLGFTGPEEIITLSGINNTIQEKVIILNDVKITPAKGKASRRKQYTMQNVLARDNNKFPKLNSNTDWSKEKNKYPHLQDLPLQNTPGDAEMIIGCDQGYLIRPFRVREDGQNNPIAIDTRLGWMVFSSNTTPSQNSTYESYSASTTTNQLDQQFTDWINMEMEPLNQPQKLQSKEEEMASQILQQTHKLPGKDRYEVPILWKDSTEPLPNNRQQAERQWLTLERRLDKDEKLKSAYNKTLHTDLEKGFIKKVPEEELQNKENPREHYIVHHPVVHPHKPDKVRRVFNFSSNFNGQSLNDRIYNGPDLLNPLTGVLTRFRTGNICLAADVSDMFLQMQVKETDEDSLRFLFRESNNQPIEIYKCVRRPLGERSAPCCANYTIKMCCKDNNQEFPLAAEVADRSFYVDDCLTSVDDNDQAIKLTKDLTQLLAKGSFKLTKWMSNNKEVLQTVPPDDQYKGLKSFNDELTTKTRTLGTVYDPDKDCFIATISQKDPASTPREFLSRIASIWDPLGHLSPFIIRGRNLQRETFTQKLHWDSLVTDPLLTKWRSWEEELLQIQGTEIPRPFRSRQEKGEPSLVSFSDASKQAKCAVNYIRTKYEDDKVDTRINIARTKLSPQKTISIPRLELDAFLMSVRLVKSTLKEQNLTIKKVTFFTDSMIVLYWVKQPSSRYRDYVAHRIADVQSELKWLEDKGYEVEVRYCPTAENPADDGTRGLTSEKLGPESRWQLGPKFLQEPESKWPTYAHEEEKIPDVMNLEVRKKCFTSRQSKPAFQEGRFSTLSKALRVLARCLRWKSKEKGLISSEELKNAQVLLVKTHQKQVFAEEINDLKEGKEVSRKSRLKRLVPFLDKDGLLRARGRLRHAPIEYSAKYPIVIDGNSHLSQLLIAKTHKETKHGSVQHVINQIRQEYWILKLKQGVKKYTQSCWFCKKERAKPTPPMMADLPPARVTPNTTPFTQVMCDYFGPITVKDRSTTRRSIPQKRWGCIFTCLSTRAVHLELANDLTTDAFINCLIRFTSRRGTCTDIYSDRGTNFIGAAKELHKNLDKEKVINTMYKNGINWHFGSPLSPHKTGAVERMVRSVKRALRCLEVQVFKSDALHTALVDIESSLNSRPLTPFTDEDPDDLRALTPNDLILLKPNTSIPLHSDEKEINARNIYKQSLAASKVFWARWIKEYLPTLLQRSKWYFEQKEPQVGELVLSAEDGIHRHKWPLARIERVIRSKDGRVRSAVLKMKNGTFTRPVVKICRIED